MKKRDLPVKICQVCQRPFAWRRKWAGLGRSEVLQQRLPYAQEKGKLVAKLTDGDGLPGFEPRQEELAVALRQPAMVAH